MDLQWGDKGSEAQFAAYVESLARCLGHKDRIEPFRRYCVGLLLPGERKSVEPMAARLRPDRTAAEHQSLLHFVGQSPWDHTALLRAVRDWVLPVMTARGPVTAWIIDDTGFPKKGPHSVGVARQYCGELGKQDNCQIAVSLSVATAEASLPIAWQLYLPETWAKDPKRRAAAKIPPDIGFARKQQIALAQLRAALAEAVPPGVVLADAGYGNSSAFRDAIAALGLDYLVGVQGSSAVWPPGMKPEIRPWSGRGRPPKRLRRGGDDAATVQVRTLAEQLPETRWHVVRWRAGVTDALCSRFAAVRARPAQGDAQRSQARPEHWLLIEWPEDAAQPTKFWLSTLPEDTPINELVHQAKQRWLIERDYHELKQELGLGHSEGRGWRGFHHHAALCIAAYGFLVAERAAFPPSGAEILRLVQTSQFSEGRQPRGSPSAPGTTRTLFDCNASTAHCPRARPPRPAMSMLPSRDATPTTRSAPFVTQ